MISNIYLSNKALALNWNALVYPHAIFDGVANLKKAWKGTQETAAPCRLSLLGRIKHLSLGLILLVPIVNTIAGLILQREWSMRVHRQPLCEGVNNLKKAWHGTALRIYTGLQDPSGPKEVNRPLSLVERVKHLSVGLLLLVPLVNTLSLLILQQAGVQRPPLYIPAPTRWVCWDRVMAPYAARNLPTLDALEYRIERDPLEVKRRLEKENGAAEKHQKFLEEFGENPLFKARAEELEKGAEPDQRLKGDAEISFKKGERTLKTVVSFEQVANRPVAFAEAQGLRPTMEDTHLVETFDYMGSGKPQEIKVTALFDGHGGKEMATYAKEHLITYLQKRLAQFNPQTLSDQGIWNALKVAMVDLSRSFPDYSGATANICLQQGIYLWMINLGDSRAILLDPQGKVVQLTEDQKPGFERYAQGIHKRGGCVLPNIFEGRNLRLDGDLAVARALGDHIFEGHVSARPKVYRYTLPEKAKATGYYLIQACDGVWDVANSAQVGALAHTLLKKGRPLPGVAADIVKASFLAESTDNISVIVQALN